MKDNVRKTGLIILFILVAFISIHPQSDEKKEIYQAFISGKMKDWKAVMDSMSAKSELNIEQKVNLVNFYYGYIGYQIGINKKDEAGKYVERGEEIIKKLIESNPNRADLYAYKGAYIGFKIGISPLKAPFIGKSSIENVNKAIRLDPNNIQANIEKANVLYYSPSAFGGNKTEAKKYYLKAIELFETNALTNQNWQYLSIMTALAKIYMSEGKYTMAKEMYEKILSVEPNYSYVKNELYPVVLKKVNGV